MIKGYIAIFDYDAIEKAGFKNQFESYYLYTCIQTMQENPFLNKNIYIVYHDDEGKDMALTDNEALDELFAQFQITTWTVWSDRWHNAKK